MDHKGNVICDFSNLVVNEVEVETTNDSIETRPPKSKPETPFFEPADYSNGALYEELNYCWSQTFTEVEIHVRLPEQVTSKNLKVIITNASIEVYANVNGERSKVFGGQLSEKCKATDAMWTIANGKKFNINIDKMNEIWWKKLLENERDIDVTKVDCSRAIHELSEDTQAQINRIQFDERQKLKGELTSEQIQQQEMLQKAWNAEGSPFKGQPFDPNIVQFQQ